MEQEMEAKREALRARVEELLHSKDEDEDDVDKEHPLCSHTRHGRNRHKRQRKRLRCQEHLLISRCGDCGQSETCWLLQRL